MIPNKKISQAIYSKSRTSPSKHSSNIKSKLIYLASRKDQRNDVSVSFGRKIKTNDNLIPPVCALDQQLQIYLRDAGSQLEVKVYRVDFFLNKNVKNPKLTKFFFGRLEIGQPLEYDDIKFSQDDSCKINDGNDSSRYQDQTILFDDDDQINQEQSINKKDSNQSGIDVQLYLKRMDMMGERDKTYSAFDEEISFPHNHDLRDNFKDDDCNDQFYNDNIEQNHLQQHHPHHERRKPDFEQTKIHRLHLSNVPMESQRGLTQANPISNWLELCYIDAKSAKNQAQFLVSKRKLKVSKMQRRSTTVSAIYTQLHVSQLKIVFKGQGFDFGRRKNIPIYLDGVDYTHEKELHDVTCIKIKQEDRFRLNIKRFMKPEI